MIGLLTFIISSFHIKSMHSPIWCLNHLLYRLSTRNVHTSSRGHQNLRILRPVGTVSNLKHSKPGISSKNLWIRSTFPPYPLVDQSRIIKSPGSNSSNAQANWIDFSQDSAVVPLMIGTRPSTALTTVQTIKYCSSSPRLLTLLENNRTMKPTTPTSIAFSTCAKKPFKSMVPSDKNGRFIAEICHPI